MGALAGIGCAPCPGPWRAYRTMGEIVPGMGHDMMIEPGWEAVADRVSEFATRK